MIKRCSFMVTLVLATVVATFPGHAKSLECSPDDDSQSFWSKAQQVAQNKANAGLKLLEKGSDKAARRAKSIFEEVVAMNPVDPMHWSNLAKAQEKLGAASEAAESLSRAKSLHAAAVSSSGRLESPPTSSSRSSRGDGKGSRRKRKDASSNTQAPQKVRRRKQSPLRDVKTIIEEAIAVAEGGDLESALELFQEAVKVGPTNGRSHENLGVTYMRLGKLAEARLSMERARALLPASDENILKNLKVLKQTEIASGHSVNDDDDYYEDYDGNDDDRAPKDSGNSANRGAKQNRETNDGYEDYDDYEDDYESSSMNVQVDAEDVTRFTDEAISLAESGDILTALPIFEKAAKLQPEKPDMHINLGVTQMRLGLLNAAKKSFNTAKNKLGGMPASNLKDNIDALKEHFAQAKRINHDANTLYREWRKDGGDDGDGYYEDDDDDGENDDDSYGTAGSAVKRSADVSTEYDPYSGDDLYDEMPERNSEESERLTGEAIDLAEAGDVATSLPLFEKAVKLDPSNAKHYENLGVTQMRLGLLIPARASFKEVKRLLHGEPSDSLFSNIEALKSHEDYAIMNGHDMNTMYPQFTTQGSGDDGDAYGDSSEDDYYSSYDDDGSYDFDDELFELSSPAAQEEDTRASSSSSSSLSPTAKSLLSEALTLAQAGNLVTALPLFERASRLEPNNPVVTENLGVNLMRLGLLNRAREQLNLALKLRQEQSKSLSGNDDGSAATLKSNLEALREHEEYATEIEHDSNTVYDEYAKEFAGLASSSKNGRSESSAGATADGYAGSSVDSPGKGRTFSFGVDLARPLGTGIDQSARIDSVVAGGQFALGGAAVGDQIVSVGSELVLSLDDFKAALKSVKDKNNANPASLLVQMTLSSTNDHGGSNLRNDGDSSAGDGVGSFDAANKKISGFCDDGINVEVVKVGDLVEVRKASAADDWIPGVVSGVRATDGAIEIAKQGKGKIMEWDHCRPL